jgi:hypothetical protein
VVWASILGLLAAGCSGGPPAPPPAKAAAGSEQGAAKPVAPKPAMPVAKPKLPEVAPPLPPLTYEAKSRRDPFAPVLLPKDRPGLDVGTLKLG